MKECERGALTGLGDAMNEAEAVDCEAFDAEAALLAIADPLKWQEHEHIKPDQRMAQTDKARYLYGPLRNTELFRVVYMPNDLLTRGAVTRNYPTLADARAACERHHATGRWD